LGNEFIRTDPISKIITDCHNTEIVCLIQLSQLFKFCSDLIGISVDINPTLLLQIRPFLAAVGIRLGFLDRRDSSPSTSKNIEPPKITA
jgi:hypothetical protein